MTERGCETQWIEMGTQTSFTLSPRSNLRPSPFALCPLSLCALPSAVRQSCGPSAMMSYVELQEAGAALMGERLLLTVGILLPHLLVYFAASTFYHVCFKYRLFDDKLVRCVCVCVCVCR